MKIPRSAALLALGVASLLIGASAFAAPSLSHFLFGDGGAVLAMATLAVTNPTLADLAKRMAPDGKIDRIVELLAQDNAVIEDMTFVEGNLPTGHRTTVRTGLPSVTWRKLYGGVQPSKSTTVQVTENTGSLEAYAEVDKKLADLNGNSAAWRQSEEAPFLEAMKQEVASTLFYGNEATEPEAFTGLAPRFNSVSTSTAQTAYNVVDHGGTGTDNTSIWLVVWGPNSCHGIVPKGIPAGLQTQDLGEVTIENVDGAGGRMQAYRSHYTWDVGLSVRDWRYIVRIANIDVSDLATVANTKNLITSMVRAAERVPGFGMGRAVWYGNRTVREALRLGILEKVASNLSWESVSGRRVMTFDDIPFKRVDALVNNEARVV